MELGLVDEYHFGVNPVILGRGTQLFKGGRNRIPLKHLETRTLKSGVVILHYGPEGRQCRSIPSFPSASAILARVHRGFEG